MKSRRRIGFPKTHDRVSMSSQRKRSNQEFAPSEMGSMVCLRSSNRAPRMSLEGHSLPTWLVPASIARQELFRKLT